MPANCTIRLTQEQMTEIQARRFGVFRIKLQVVDVQHGDLPREIFLYVRQVVDNFDQQNDQAQIMGDTCVGVCTLPDIADYPAWEPDPATTYQFFRKDYAIWDFRSVLEGKQAIDEIVDRVNKLAASVDAAADLRLARDFWTPVQPALMSIRPPKINSHEAFGIPRLNLIVYPVAMDPASIGTPQVDLAIHQD